MHYAQHYGHQWRVVDGHSMSSKPGLEDDYPTPVEDLTDYILKSAVYSPDSNQAMHPTSHSNNRYSTLET